MTTDLVGLSRKFEVFADCLTGEQLKRAMRKGGTAGKKAALEVATQVAGGDRTIVMGGRRKVRLNAGYDIHGTELHINLRPPGLWILFEKGAREHQIPGPRKRRAKILTLVDGSFATTVFHPGRSGVRAVGRAFAKVSDEAPKAVSEAMWDEMVRAWR